MRQFSRTTDPQFWLDQMFAAEATCSGGVVRRSQVWLDREVGRERLFAAVRECGFHLVRTGDQFIVICHGGPIDIPF